MVICLRWPPRTRKTTGGCLTNWASITSSLTRRRYFKNLETRAKMECVAGIQTGGSEGAFDVYMKARYFGEQHAGHAPGSARGE